MPRLMAIVLGFFGGLLAAYIFWQLTSSKEEEPQTIRIDVIRFPATEPEERAAA